MKLRKAFSLIEILLAIVIIVTVIVATIPYVMSSSQKVKTASCEMQSSELQIRADLYRRKYGKPVSSDLSEVFTASESRVCPVDQEPFRYDLTTGKVIVHKH